MGKLKTAAVILAAGKGTRMRSDIPKVLHLLNGKPLISRVVESTNAINPSKIISVVGFGAEKVKEALQDENLSFVIQEQQLGTAHAVMQTKPQLQGERCNILVLSGDVPLIKPKTLQKLLLEHEQEGNAITFLTMEADDPSGYGRVVRDSSGGVTGIIEDRDATDSEKKIKEINGGVYMFDSEFLFSALENVSADNSQGEQYLPDVLPMAIAEKKNIGAIKLASGDELFGVNTIKDLEELSKMLGDK